MALSFTDSFDYAASPELGAYWTQERMDWHANNSWKGEWNVDKFQMMKLIVLNSEGKEAFRYSGKYNPDASIQFEQMMASHGTLTHVRMEVDDISVLLQMNAAVPSAAGDIFTLHLIDCTKERLMQWSMEMIAEAQHSAFEYIPTPQSQTPSLVNSLERMRSLKINMAPMKTNQRKFAPQMPVADENATSILFGPDSRPLL